jgi:NifU-like protein involved in Fe-S cluster formation
MDNVQAHEHALLEYALGRLAEVPGLTLHGPDASQKGAVATFTIDDIHAHDIAQLLDAEGIAVRAGHHCAMPLHDSLGIPASARASFYLYNTFAEVDALIEGLATARRKFAPISNSAASLRNMGIFDPADVDCEGDYPTCGDHLRLTLRIDENKRITAVGWDAQGCSISQASASMLGEEIMGKTLDDVKQIGKQDIFDMLGVSLTPSRVRCALLSLEVLTVGLFGTAAWHEHNAEDEG